MSEESQFFKATSTDDLRFVRHNPTDFDAFKKFQAGIDEKFAKTEEERAKKERKNNLKTWGEQVGSRWASASLRTIENNAAEEVIGIIKTQQAVSFWITGEAGSGKSYLAHAILRAYIGSGWTTPSQIERISEEVLFGMAATGFEGMARFNKLLSPQHKVYLFDGVLSKFEYTAKERQLWEQLIDHIYSNSLIAVFTSNEQLASFASRLSDSGASKLSHLVESREILSLSTFENRIPSGESNRGEPSGLFSDSEWGDNLR